MKMVQDIIIAPVITEASMDRIANKTYTFKVAKNATKPEIAHAVEVMFGVKVDKVNTINVYDILNANKFVVSKAAVAKLEEVFA